jgi:hypothetical protein
MALDLQQIRDLVRTSLDIEQEDLPDVLLDAYIREGSKRIERAEARWPFYEVRFDFAPTPSVDGLYDIAAIDPELDQIASIAISPFGPLQWIGADVLTALQGQQPSTVGRPRFYSTWAASIAFHPQLDVVYDMEVRGYRRALDWVSDGAGATPDLPDELHNTVALWALGKAYAQQEDPELAGLYERQFSDELNEFRRRLVVTPQHQPLVLNGGVLGGTNTLLLRPRFDWELN